MYKLFLSLLVLGSVMATLESVTCDKDGYLDLLADEVIIDAQALNKKDQTAILTNQRILFLDNDYNEVFNSLTLPTEDEAAWYKLVQNDDGSNLYVVGNATNGTHVLTSAKCEVTGCSMFGNTQILTGIKTQIKDWQYVENSLLVLTNTQLVFFNLTASGDEFIVRSTKYTLDTDFFGYSWQTPQNFDVQQFQADEMKNYKIFVVAYQYGFWVDCAVRSKQLIPYVNGQISFQQSIFNFDSYNDCYFLREAIDNGTHISSVIQLITDSSTQRALEITYISFELVDYQVTAQLAQFRDWKAVANTFSHFNEEVSLIYTNSKGAAAIVFYDLSVTESFQGLGIDVKNYVIVPVVDKYLTYVSTSNDSHFINFRSDENVFTQCSALSIFID